MSRKFPTDTDYIVVSDPIRIRLLELAEGHGVSLARLSLLLGKNASYLQQFIKRGSPRKLEENDRARLAQFFGVEERELGRLPSANTSIADVIDGGHWALVPRLPLDASAGPGAELVDERSFDTIRFSERWLRAMGLKAGSLSTITVTGDSMEPTLRAGDEILVDRTRRSLGEGIFVVRIEHSLMVKRLDRVTPKKVVLLSDNPIYPPVTYLLSDVEIIGQVVWKGGPI